MAAVVGRARELAEIDRLLADASEGVGGLLLVSGPAGIGKTRLADAAADRAERRTVRVRRGGAVDDAGAPPLWPWRGLVTVPSGEEDWTAAAVDEGDAARSFRVLVDMTCQLTGEAAEQATLVILEDFHWADRMSVRLLRHVAAELRTSRLAIVVTARPGDGVLAAALPELARGESFRALELTGLTAAEVTAWLPFLTGRQDTALATAVWQATGGNPLLVRLIAAEMAGSTVRIHELLESRPQLRQMIAGRVAALSSSAREVVEAASVLGQRIEPSVVAALVGRAVDADLETIRKAGIARGLGFDHALVRDAVYAGLPVTRRVELHRAAAAVLEQQTQPQPGIVAMHWQEAGMPAECLPWAGRAYQAARMLPAYEDAIRWAEVAVSCARETGADVAEPLLCLAQALALAGHFERAAAVCLEVAEAAESARRDDLLAAAALVVQGVGNSYLHQQLMPLYDRALTVVPAQDHATRARLMAQRAVAAAEIEGGSRCAALAAEALAEAERSSDPNALIDAIAARHLSITVPDTVAERRALADRAVELGRAADRPIAALWGHLWRAQAAVQLGDMDDADRQVVELDRIARHRGSPLARWHHLRHLAARQAQVGDFSAARQSNAAADQLALQMGDPSLRGMTFAFLLQLAMLRGDHHEIPAEVERLLAVAPPMPLIRLTRPIWHALAGDLDLARAEFAEFRHLPDTFPYGVRWLGTVTQIGYLSVLLDDAEAADAVRRRLARYAGSYLGDGSGAVLHLGAADGLLADLARVAGRTEEAAARYQRAVALNVRIGARPFTATARLGWARTLAAEGAQQGQAKALLDEAAAEFQRLDMPGPLRLATTVREDIGARSVGTALTAREREVATLVAAALSNREIAGRLTVSERTVESHVRNVLAKLGFTTRTQIATWAVGEYGRQAGRGR